MGKSDKAQKRDSKQKKQESKQITPAEKEEVVESKQEESEESSDEEDASDADSGLEDDFEVADVSSDESEDGSGDDEESDDEFPLRKKKKTSNDGGDQFASAFNAIIGSKLKAYDRKDPILARNKSTLKKLESDKLEKKAKRELLAEKRQIQDKVRVRNLLPAASEPEKVREIIEKEKKLKKVAQRGVVKLFNAVLATQVKTKEEMGKTKVSSGKQEEMLNELSKSKFLDLVKAAGNT
ncbi:hypothetical protein FT663_02466 [Candidozyma haemuli var. vulneris]|uniref:Ribosomal RNA-processing protein 15 n=1 Tax=Candidozyma haemuli TaxID=45357 RepID=A0A2V1ASV1_9ASCO|nr:hypothetical protein CXQ85_002380 [[Candida] haemuloni]KAF3989896.1 hypothetical protein FT662_02574 [[Candida] haemuloni var. vulneris]KAF3992022.1 hypothetical protein FT663_02466 [[Candida] haemuloni var. vulneris]PVH20586.1 hypothetical protein CXQ85_002380 [[Candida] haemuloni]